MQKLSSFPVCLLLFAAALLFLPEKASAAAFRTAFFSIDLPSDWSLVQGPFKKNGGEAAVLGRRDRKASVQLLYGPTRPGNFRAIAADYARSLQASEPSFSASQAWFSAERNGHTLHFLFRQDAAGKQLVIFIFNGNPADMSFVFSGFRSSLPGLAPDPVFAPKPAAPRTGQRRQGSQR